MPPGDQARRRQEVDRLAMLINRAVKISMFAGNLDICLIEFPTITDAVSTMFFLALAEGGFQDGGELHDPAMDGRMVEADAALFHHFLEIAQAQTIGEIPAYAEQHDVERVAEALDDALEQILHGSVFGLWLLQTDDHELSMLNATKHNRLFHHVHVENITCDSYRLREHRKAGIGLTKTKNVTA
jgi:hypothetical protein